MLADFHLIWRDQCDAAECIRERFGRQKALGYLIGEKLVNFVHATSTDRDFAMELPNLVAEARSMFHANELRDYLDNVKRLGSFGHICSDEEHELFPASGAIADDPVGGAHDVLILEQVRELLLGE